jgi:hypothetical protein
MLPTLYSPADVAAAFRLRLSNGRSSAHARLKSRGYKESVVTFHPLASTSRHYITNAPNMKEHRRVADLPVADFGNGLKMETGETSVLRFIG